MAHPALSAAWRRARPGLVGLALVGLLAAPSAPALANVSVNGGSVSNNTDLGLTVDGGTAIGDASGGSNNLAFVAAGCFNNNNNNNNCRDND
ncbi:MAG TPA: hypothetical protein VFU81_21185 [Thermomicrobiales bacterium]|nr:hypothetical protein [Thermomicrobiales bacterium]